MIDWLLQTPPNEERDRLHIESIKLLALELNNLEKDPAGRMLDARERRCVQT